MIQHCGRLVCFALAQFVKIYSGGMVQQMKNLYRKIPKVDLMLEMPGIQKLIGTFGRKTVTESVRKETDLLRGFLKDNEQMLRQMSASAEEKEEKEQELTAQFEEKLAGLEDAVEKQLVKEDRIGFCRVLNATGTILHTNLGRSPISREHAEKIADLVSGYSNLEVPDELLIPAKMWQDQEAYKEAAKKLSKMFVDNFAEKYSDMPAEVIAAGPKAE